MKTLIPQQYVTAQTPVRVRFESSESIWSKVMLEPVNPPIIDTEHTDYFIADYKSMDASLDACEQFDGVIDSFVL